MFRQKDKAFNDKVYDALKNANDLPIEYKTWLRNWLTLNPPSFMPSDLARLLKGSDFETVMNMASTFLAGSITGANTQMGYGAVDDGTGQPEIDTSFLGFRAYNSSGENTFRVDAVTGQLFFTGTMGDSSIVGATFAWGTASALRPDDTVDYQLQSSPGFATATVAQHIFTGTSGTLKSGTTVNAVGIWPFATTTGNHLFLMVTARNGNGHSITIATPSGWTLAKSQASASGDLRTAIFYRAASSSRSGAENVTLTTTNGDVYSYTVELVEVSGLDGAVDKTAGSTGTSNAPSSGATAALSQAQEFAIGTLAQANTDAQTAPSGGFSYLDDDTESLLAPSRSYFYTQSVSATSALKLGATTTNTPLWVGAVATFRRKSLTVAAPVSGKVRMYAKNDGKFDRLAFQGSDGVEKIVATEDIYVNTSAAYIQGASTTAERTLMESAAATGTTQSLVVANVAGAVYKITVTGVYAQTTAGNITLRLKIGTAALDAYNIAPPASNQTGQGFVFEAMVVVKTTGATGKVGGYTRRDANGASSTEIGRGIGDVTVDLTAGGRLDVTAQYAASSASNGFTIDSAVCQRIA